MTASIDHYLNSGGHIQLGHGDNCLSLIINNLNSKGGTVLTPTEARELAMDLIVQAKAAETVCD